LSCGGRYTNKGYRDPRMIGAGAKMADLHTKNTIPRGNHLRLLVGEGGRQRRSGVNVVKRGVSREEQSQGSIAGSRQKLPGEAPHTDDIGVGGG